MEPKFSKVDEQIDRGAAFWQSYPVPSIPPAGVIDAKKRPNKSLSAYRWTATALACAIAGTILLWPASSHAGGLEKTAAALEAERFYGEHVKSMVNGKVITDFTIWNNRGDIHVLSSGVSKDEPASEQWLIRGESTQYFHGAGYALQFHRSRPGHALVGLTNVRRLIEMNGKGSVKEFENETWHGHKVVRYELNTGPFKDARGQAISVSSTMIVDPTSNLPLQISSPDGGMGASVCDFEYPAFDPKLMEVMLPASVQIYDLDRQREEIKQAVMTPIATTEVAGKKIQLRALVVDYSGVLGAWTTGGKARPFQAREKLTVDTLRLFAENSHPGFGIPKPTGTPANGGVQWTSSKPKPEMFKGLALVKEEQSFARDTVFPKKLTVRIPVWGDDPEKPLGWAVFKDVKPTLTGSTVQLMWPLNVDIFVAKPNQLP